MANIGQFEVGTTWTKLEDIIGTSVSVGVTYLIQNTGFPSLLLCELPIAPSGDIGFTINKNEKLKYIRNQGSFLWVRAFANTTTFNIAETTDTDLDSYPFQLKDNISQDYNNNSENTYPSSKALKDAVSDIQQNIGNGLLTLQQNGATIGTFSANSSENKTINITGATSGDYSDLNNKPSINGVTLSGNKTGADLSLVSAPTVVNNGDNTGLVIQANKIYKFATTLTTLTITSAEVSDYESRIYFTTGDTITFTDNSGLKWRGGDSAPSLKAYTIYCIRIRNGLAEIDSFGKVQIGEYQIVDYIKQTGTQYIMTNYKPSNDVRIETYMKFLTKTGGDSSKSIVFGSEGNGQALQINFVNNPSSPSLLNFWIKAYSGSGDIRQITNDNYATIQKVAITNTQFVWGNSTQTKQTPACETDLYCVIFGGNTNGTVGIQNYLDIELHNYFKIWEGTTLVANFIPVLNILTNKYGLYDTVNQTFFGNEGSGDFSGGNI